MRYVEKAKEQVRDRLTKEIHYWDHRANELMAKEQAGVNVRMQSGKARTRAEELANRLKTRMKELDLEAHLSPSVPIVMGGAFIVPKGLLMKIKGDPVYIDTQKRKEVEMAAMKKVIEVECALGRDPKDVSKEKGLGYDVISAFPEGGRYLFIEVKGRSLDQDTVTVTRNEMMASLNKPNDFRLAIVKVENKVAQNPIYVKQPFDSEPGFAQISATFDLGELIRKGEQPI